MSTNTESRSAKTEMESESESESSKDPCLRNWLELPRDVTASSLLRLGAVEIIESAQKVCTQWRNICKDPSICGTLVTYIPCPMISSKMCMHAIDRSCCGLVDINIEYFGTDELLTYITQRSSHLKRLRLVSCYNISDKGLSEAPSELPFLEELEISHCSISKDALETIGRCCSLLKSFKFNMQGCRCFHLGFDDEALAISQTMPELRHLQLFGNKLTNDGLLAILNGCLGGILEKRCFERIKNLRRPYDSTHDYEFDAGIHGPEHQMNITHPEFLTLA